MDHPAPETPPPLPFDPDHDLLIATMRASAALDDIPHVVYLRPNPTAQRDIVLELLRCATILQKVAIAQDNDNSTTCQCCPQHSLRDYDKPRDPAPEPRSHD